MRLNFGNCVRREKIKFKFSTLRRELANELGTYLIWEPISVLDRYWLGELCLLRRILCETTLQKSSLSSMRLKSVCNWPEDLSCWACFFFVLVWVQPVWLKRGLATLWMNVICNEWEPLALEHVKKVTLSFDILVLLGFFSAAVVRLLFGRLL